MSKTLLSTPLTSDHIARGARMTDFAGWSMPLQYTGVQEEHLAVRSGAGLFDLTHMAEIVVTGAGRIDFVQQMVTNDVSKLENGQAMYTCLCGSDAGILDDLLVYRFAEEVWIVANASNRDKVVAWLTQHADDSVTLNDRTQEIALVAIQGPMSEKILAPHTDTCLSEIDFYSAKWGKVLGSKALISRTGYTGEDGFELYLDYKDAAEVWSKLLAGDEGLIPVGLAARDTLRLESGFALYGNELLESRTPFDVSLAWITKTETQPAPKYAEALRSAKGKSTTCLVGLSMEGRTVPRAGYEVHCDGARVGEVTSGTFSPSLQKGVALAIVERTVRSPGTSLEVIIRGKPQQAEVVKLPFVRGSVKRHS